MTEINNLPAALRERALFCCWRYEERDGRRTKVPYNPRTGGRAQSTNPDTFAPLQAAAQVQGRYDGLGVGIFGRLGAIDIDHCVSEEGGLSDLAAGIMSAMNAYTEYSPSGKGIRILFTVPEGFQYDKARYYINNQKAGLEVYIAGSTNKFVTVTGNTITPGKDLEERGEALGRVLERYMVRPTPSLTPSAADNPAPVDALDDLALIERAKQSRKGADFARLWAGDISGYQSHSEADIALCNALAWWTNGDAGRVDRLFRQSGLMRQKWDRPQSGSTYGAITVQNAVAGLRGGYDPANRGQAIEFDFGPEPSTSTKTTAVPAQGGAADIQRLHIISAPELQVANLPPVRYMVEGMLPEGIGLLSAASKTGKSWMVLSMGLKIAAGEPFMGHQTNQCGVLYLALEDSLSRLQDRMNKILKGRPAPPLFYFTTEAPNLDQGLLATLDDHIQQHPETKLIIIDTLQKIRGPALPREASYAQDYREMGMVKAHMDKKGVSVFFVHHNRKMVDEGDPFNMISGTNGIMGAADTIFVITKDKRADQEATLHITGRDVEQSDTVIQFNKDTWEWDVVGAADWLQEQRERLAYESSPIVKTIKKLLEQSPEHRWDGTCKELLEAGQYIAHTYLAATPQKLGYELRKLDKPLLERDGIIHTTIKTGGNYSHKHCFYYQDFGLLEELPDDEPVPFSYM